MKKFLAFCMAIAIMSSICAVAFAADSNTTELKLEITQPESDYTVTIPAEVVLTQDTTNKTTATGTETIQLVVGSILGAGMKKVKVTVKNFANDANGNHNLVCTGNDSLTYSAKLGTTDIVTGEYTSAAATVIVSGAVTETKSANISFALTKAITQAGTFKDKLTFSVGEVAA